MKDSPLINKSKAFALHILRLCDEVKSAKKSTVIMNQLSRSGTSIGANIREAFYGHSKADFVAKLQIALKECSESEYWIELLIESGCCDDSSIADECIELKKLLITSINTAKKNASAAQRRTPAVRRRPLRQGLKKRERDAPVLVFLFGLSAGFSSRRRWHRRRSPGTGR